MNILVTGAFPLRRDEAAALEGAGHTVSIHLDERAPVKSPERYEAVVCNALFQYNDIARFTALRYIQLTSAGMERVPLDYLRAHGIERYNASGIYSIPMAEFVVCGILQLYKQSRFFAENQRRHQWEKHRGLSELAGKRACILGCGDVGREIAKRLQAFGCRVTGVNRTVRKTAAFDEIRPLEQLLEAASVCDIFVCCIALTPQTRGIVSSAVFERMRADAVFVNVARGALVDEKALLAWLRKGGRAVLDVFEEEPLPDTDPRWDMQRVILTPHNSFVGEGTHERLWQMIRERWI